MHGVRRSGARGDGQPGAGQQRSRPPPRGPPGTPSGTGADRGRATRSRWPHHPGDREQSRALPMPGSRAAPSRAARRSRRTRRRAAGPRRPECRRGNRSQPRPATPTAASDSGAAMRTFSAANHQPARARAVIVTARASVASSATAASPQCERATPGGRRGAAAEPAGGREERDREVGREQRAGGHAAPFAETGHPRWHRGQLRPPAGR